MLNESITQFEALLSAIEAKLIKTKANPRGQVTELEIVELFRFRSGLARRIGNDDVEATELSGRIVKMDERLEKLLPKLYNGIKAKRLDYFREIFRAEVGDWWWYGVIRQKTSKLMSTLGLFLVAAAFALTLDVFQRFSNKSLDWAGFLAIVIPGGLIAIGATTFSNVGKPHFLTFARKYRYGVAFTKLGICLLIFVLTFSIRQYGLPKLAQYYASTCIANCTAGRYYTAADNGDQALRLDPDLPDVHLNYAYSLAKIQNWDKFMEESSKAIELYSNSFDAWNLRNIQAHTLCFQKQDYAGAKKIASDVIDNASKGRVKIGPLHEDSLRVNCLRYSMYRTRAAAHIGIDSLDDAKKDANVALFWFNGKGAHLVLADYYRKKATQALSRGDLETAASMQAKCDQEIDDMDDAEPDDEQIILHSGKISGAKTL